MSVTGRPVAPAADRAAVVVELCGLPGAGKSTLALALLDLLRDHECVAEAVDGPISALTPRYRRLPRKAVMVGRALVTAPIAQGRAVRVVGTGQPSTRDMFAMSVRWAVAQQLLRQGRRCSGAALVDEGLVQALWSAGLRSGSATVPRLVALASTTARPDIVVHVDVPVELAVERLRSRSSRHSRVQQLRKSEQLAEMRKGDVLLRGLLAEWRRRGLGQVIVVNAGAHSPGEVSIAAAVLERLRAEKRR